MIFFSSNNKTSDSTAFLENSFFVQVFCETTKKKLKKRLFKLKHFYEIPDKKTEFEIKKLLKDYNTWSGSRHPRSQPAAG